MRDSESYKGLVMPINRNLLDTSLASFFIVLNTALLILPSVSPVEDSEVVVTSTTKQMQRAGATDVLADYTPTGARITWTAPTNSELVQKYRVEASYDGWIFEEVALVEVGENSIEVDKVDTPHITAFRVVTIYSDDEVFSETSGLKGQYAPQGR